jgi:putative transposase
MRKSKFSKNQIISLFKEVEKGQTVKDVCHEHSVSEATYYQWNPSTAVWNLLMCERFATSKARIAD